MKTTQKKLTKTKINRFFRRINYILIPLVISVAVSVLAILGLYLITDMLSDLVSFNFGHINNVFGCSEVISWL